MNNAIKNVDILISVAS